MLADFAQRLWSFISGLFSGLYQAISDSVGGILGWLGTEFGNLMGFLGRLAQNILNGIADVLHQIFLPIFAIIDAIFYFIEKLTYLLALLVQLLIQVVHVLLAYCWGFIKTLTGLVYDQSSPQLPSSVYGPFSHMVTALQMLQLDKLADLLLFAIWISTAIGAIRIISTFSQGGGGE
ncbi:MAG: hypothetical protein K6T31_07755 [Alicyclobacillus sp.]|nr:hypothetical protein [Alicyclobacillus sp.]